MSNYEDKKIVLSDEIKAIILKNLDEKSEEVTVKVDSCKDCRYYDKYWNHGGELHVCSCDYELPIVSRDINELYENCLIDNTYSTIRCYIKRYGIVHHKATRCRDGSISIVDFRDTVFEWDGYNPDVNYDFIVTFYYSSQEDVDAMMELALEYYNRFNLDEVFTRKRTYG